MLIGKFEQTDKIQQRYIPTELVS